MHNHSASDIYIYLAEPITCLPFYEKFLGIYEFSAGPNPSTQRTEPVMSLTKADIVESISDQCGYSKNRSTELLEATLEALKSTLESGEQVLISGFGKFCVKAKNGRGVRNHSTGNDLTPGARRIVVFRCSPVMREKLNGKG